MRGQTPFWDNTFTIPGAQAGPLVGLYGGTPGQDLAVAPGYEGPLYSPFPWQQFFINGRVLPGIAEVLRCAPRRRVDNKKHAGSDGANPTMHGYDPNEIQVRVHIWTPMQLAELEDQLVDLWPRKAKSLGTTSQSQGSISTGVISVGSGVNKAFAFDVAHPQLGFAGVKSVLVKGITTLSPSSLGPNVRSMDFEMIEFAPVKSTKSVVRTDTSARPMTPNLTPNNAPPRAVQQSGVDYSPTNSAKLPPSQSAASDP